MNLKQLSDLEAAVLVYGTANTALQKFGKSAGPDFAGIGKANLKELSSDLGRVLDLIQEIGTEYEA